ncbi:MAG TPA: glycosyltransferase family 4 protein, partial [Longimicrobiaceae bacterium]|nr:glycosyltransferase family 4 protein [Longimicrobiaceae bacterium]
KLREELEGLGHECRLLLGPELGSRPANPRLRWAMGPLLAEGSIRRAFRDHGPFDVVDIASAEGEVVGLRRRLGGYRGVGVVSRSHGLEHLNYRRMLDDAAAGIVPKPWHRRLWYPVARLTQVKAAARLADRLIVLNEGDRDYVLGRRWKRAEGVQVVPHGVSERFLVHAPPPDAPRGGGLLFCGSWDPVKGIDYLVRAMAMLAAAPGGAPRLTVLGAGVPEEGVLGAFPPAVRPLVTVLPRAEEDEVMRHYREHDVLVMTSTYEGFGMVVVEAMSQRLPVVATAVGCAPALLGRGAGGIVVPPRDPEALAAAVRRLLDDPALRRRLGDAGHAAVRGMSWTATALRTLEVYAAARAAAARGRRRRKKAAEPE